MSYEEQKEDNHDLHLFIGHLEALQYVGVVELLDGHLPCLRESEVPEEHRSAEGEGVHIFGAHPVHLEYRGYKQFGDQEQWSVTISKC